MNKELFIESINNIEKQFEIDKKCHDAFSIILPNDYVSGYDYNLILKQLLKLLKIEFNDINDWIGYFIWELDFGKSFKLGMVKDNGQNCDLSNSEKLYEFLCENKKLSINK